MSSINSGSIVLAGAPNVKISNVTLLAETEFAHVLENNVSVLEFKTRSGEPFRYSFTIGEIDTNYISVPECSGQSFAGIKLVGKTIYIKSLAPCIVEIIEFYS